MKHKLLFALSSAFLMSMSAMAQWTAPVEPVLGDDNVASVEAGKSYYFKNVGAGQYITGSNAWSTQASFTRSGINDTFSPALLLLVEEKTETWGTGLALKLDGSFTVNGESGKRSFTGTYIFRDSEDAGFIDYNNQGRGTLWTITKAENGYYHIQTIAGDPAYPNAATQYAGWDSTDGPIVVDEDGNLVYNEETGAPGSTKIVFNMTGTAENEHIDWIIIDPTEFLAKKEVYLPRKELYDLLVSTNDLGFTVDTSAATAVYNNANATKDELVAAVAALKATINRAEFASQFYGTEDDPQDVTDLVLKNPTFDNDILNWTITVGGQNLQWQQRTDGHVDESQNWVQITNFIEAWIPAPNHLGDGTISQTIYGLPAGKYILECDAMATLQGGSPDPESAVEGAYIFIQTESNEIRTPIQAPDTQPKHWSVVLISDGSDWMTFGLKVENTTANWISADNFKLWYLGETTDTPELAILRAELEKAQALAEESEFNNIESTDNINYSNEARTALSNAISEAESAISGDAAAQTAATKALQDAVAAVNASKGVYAQFKAVYESGNVVLDQLAENNQWTGLQTSIEEFLEGDLLQAFEAGTLSADQLEEYQTKVNTLVQEFVSDPSVIHVGDDLTILLANPHFTQGNGRNINTVPGWVVNNGSMTELRASTHNIETYHAQFDISQTLHNVPAGVYDVTLQGFARHDGGDTDNTWLYGGIGTAKLISLNDDENQMRDTPIYSADNLETYPNLGDANYDNTAANGMYKANGMTGAYHWFREINPNTGEPYYTNHVEVVLDKAGDLTIGIHCQSTMDWVIFDNFRIKYTGMNVAVFAKMVEEKKTELSNLYDTQEPTAIATDIDKLVAEKLAINTSDIDNADDALAAIAEIDAVIAKVKESTAAYTALGEVIEYFEVKVGEASLSVSGDFSDLVDEERGKYESGYATIDAMKAAQNALAEGWAGAASQDIQAGDDVTELILNPIYEGLIDGDGAYGDNFWTSDSYHGADFSCCEFFNYQGNNEHFTHSQTLKGIKPGYYTVSVDGFYRYGDYNPNTDAGTPGAGNAYANGEEELNPVMFVKGAEGDNSIALKSIFEGVQPDMIGVGGEVQAEGVTGYIPNNMQAAQAYLEMGLYNVSLNVKVGDDGVLTIGIRKSQALLNDWTIFTGWTLKYLGTEAPDAVEAIEAQAAGKAAIFGIDGRQQSQLRRGINIVRSNGKVQKVLVK